MGVASEFGLVLLQDMGGLQYTPMCSADRTVPAAPVIVVRDLVVDGLLRGRNGGLDDRAELSA